MYTEEKKRSLLKAVSYRILSILMDSIFAFLLTKRVDATIGIVLVMNTYSTFLYYTHERVWDHFRFGKKAR